MHTASMLVEGPLDAMACKRILQKHGVLIGTVYGQNGIGYIKNKVRGFNQSVGEGGNFILVLVDFRDTRRACPPEVVSQWVPHRSENLIFRVVVHELESWLLADRENIASFLKIGIGKIPLEPESLPDPKRTLVDLARKSRKKTVREALVPERGSTAQVGKLYASEMQKFILERWEPDRARQNAPSLDRCLNRLETMFH